MFNNLIESSSHAREYKRRGSFLLFTGSVYLALFVVTGVVSIYAYDAHLERQTTDLELLSWVPQPPPEIVQETPANPVRPASNATAPDRPIRTQLIDSVSNPNNVPDQPGTTASAIPPAPRGAVLGIENVDPIGPPAGTRNPTGGTGNPVVVPDMPDGPPPPPQKPAVPKLIKVSRVLNSEAISLPPPSYPPIARQTRTQGSVIVQVLIDEEGKVIQAKATSGHVLLVPAAQTAALRARFSPTVLGDQKVKVQGVITYNFVLGN